MRYPPTWVDSPVQANPQTNTLEGTSKFITLMKEGIDYSRNVVGYINLTLTNTYSLIGNQLDNGAGNLVTNMFMGLPTQTVIYKFNGAYAFSSLTYLGARGWTPVAHHQMTLAPGEGVFVKKPTGAATINVAFIGEVMQGYLVRPVILGNGMLVATGRHLVAEEILQVPDVELHRPVPVPQDPPAAADEEIVAGLRRGEPGVPQVRLNHAASVEEDRIPGGVLILPSHGPAQREAAQPAFAEAVRVTRLKRHRRCSICGRPVGTDNAAVDDEGELIHLLCYHAQNVEPLR